MHILFICHEYPKSNHGGIGSFTKDLAEGLVSTGFKVSVLGIYARNVLNLEKDIYETINGVDVIRLLPRSATKFNLLNVILNRIHLLRSISALNKNKKLDIIECPDSQGWLPFQCVGHIPLVTRLHGGESYFSSILGRKSSRINRIFEYLQLRHSNQIVAVSKFTGIKTLELFKLDNLNLKVIYNSIKIPTNKEIGTIEIENSPNIFFSGSVIKKKGIVELVQAMNIVCEKFPSCSLYIAGKIPPKFEGENTKDFLLSKIVKKEICKQINFLGPINRDKELFPLINLVDVCCFPSYAEAFALAPLECMALAKPVINSALTSGPEAIIDGDTGLLCNPKDPKDIANKIIQILSDKKFATNIGQKAKQRFDDLFCYQKWLKENIEFYRSLLNKYEN